MPNFSLALLLPVALILFLLSFALYYLWARLPRSGTVEWIHMRDKPAFAFGGGRHAIDKLDILAIVLIAVIWSALAFFHLGDRDAPQSFHGFGEEYVTIELGQSTDIGRVRYYTGLGDGAYALYFSADSMNWVRQGSMTQGFAEQFKWLEAEVLDGRNTWFIRLRAESAGTLYLGELAIYDISGRRLEPGHFSLQWSVPARGTGGLFDEQHTVPDQASFLNSMYFDEIYHAQAAYQMTEGLWPSTELSHPPLGKILMAIGIQIFGMTPFGWRFVGTAMSVLILVLFYLLVKGMFGKRFVAVCSTTVFAMSFMHFSQTRIATIDTYAVLFVLLQFWFIYRYISQDYETPFKKTLPSLALAGVFFGLGAAAKWSSLYLAPALALLWVIYQVLRGKHYDAKGIPGFRKYLLHKILISCVFFLIVPAIIYYLSYIPYSSAMGYSFISRGHFDIVIENQRHMWWFHGAVAGVEHPFSSYWWQWVFNLRPMLYYASDLPDGMFARIMAFGNPAVYWGGLLAMIAMPVAAFKRGDGRALAILIGYLMLLLPWVFIPRTSFAYHYFTNLIFICLAIAYIFDHMIRRERGHYKTAILAFTAVCIALFVLFYPVLAGWPMSDWYAQHVLRWFQSWPIYT
ncbi:MAG: glycosyltransferase family 39 protein [Oscillospiraceae bacterium]|nr:glycosyltransferase family 39 protein [Oscillospiraceae bacterium]